MKTQARDLTKNEALAWLRDNMSKLRAGKRSATVTVGGAHDTCTIEIDARQATELVWAMDDCGFEVMVQNGTINISR